MIDSIFVALSGMLGHQRGLNVISNNIANMNTPAFRGSRTSFTDVFVGAAPTGLPRGQQSLGGVDASRTQLDLRRGDRQATGRDLDLMLQGEGYFVLQTEDGETRYTRDGRFDFLDGELVLANEAAVLENDALARDRRLRVMARNANGELVPVTLKDLQVHAGKATTEITFQNNLSTFDNEHVIDSLAVFDKNGAQHTLRVTFTRMMATNGATSSWKVTVSEGTQEIGTGTLEFLGTRPIPSSEALSMTLQFSGADPAEVSFNFRDVNALPLGTMMNPTQSNVSVSSQDGFAPGTITGMTFDDQGVLKITYSNGQRVDGAKLALAQINDQKGLVEVGNSLFVYEGAESVTLREAGNDLRVLAQSLEQSNVDLTEQFSQLILMQRGYQASSQVLSTANDMLQELFDIRGQQ